MLFIDVSLKATDTLQLAWQHGVRFQLMELFDVAFPMSRAVFMIFISNIVVLRITDNFCL